MYVKLSKQDFGYLMQNCKFIKSMSIVYENNTLVKISINEKEADDIREWALDELEFRGFDENYELNKNGQILERLVDLFFRQNKQINSRGYFITVCKPKISAPEAPVKEIKFYDSSKTVGIVTGGTISAGIDTYSQYTKNNNSFNNYDPLSAVINTAVGLYTGGASNMLSAITRGAAGNAASEIYSQATDLSKDIDGKRILLKTGIGGFVGFATSGSGKLGEKIPRGKDGNYKTILENIAGAAMGLIQAEVDNRQ